MKRIVIACVFVLALAILAGAVVVAQGRGMCGRLGCQMAPAAAQPMSCQQMLDLSQSQVADQQRLQTAFLNDTATLRTQMQTKQQEMAALWTEKVPNLKRIKAKAAEIDQIRARIQDQAIDLHYNILTKVLTPDQRAKCAQCCQSGQCGMGCGLGAGMCPMGCMGPGAGMCAGPGACMGPGAGMGRAACGAGMGPNGTGCPLAR